MNCQLKTTNPTSKSLTLTLKKSPKHISNHFINRINSHSKALAFLPGPNSRKFSIESGLKKRLNLEEKWLHVAMEIRALGGWEN